MTDHHTTFKRRLEAGLCGRCGKPNNNGHVRCDSCMAYEREYYNGRYQILVLTHRCSHCGRQMPQDWYYVTCEKCKKKLSDSMKRYREARRNGKAG